MSKFVYVITLGSSKVKDAPFASAALNPYPLGPLLLFSLFTYASAGIVGIVAGALLGGRVFRLSSGKTSSQSGVGEDRKAPSSRGTWFRRILLLLIPLPILLAIAVPYVIVDQAVLARRIYEADRDIVAPFLNPQQLAEIQAEFCAITTKAQYIVLIDKLRLIAEAHQTKLRMEQVK